MLLVAHRSSHHIHLSQLFTSSFCFIHGQMVPMKNGPLVRLYTSSSFLGCVFLVSCERSRWCNKEWRVEIGQSPHPYNLARPSMLLQPLTQSQASIPPEMRGRVTGTSSLSVCIGSEYKTAMGPLLANGTHLY